MNKQISQQISQTSRKACLTTAALLVCGLAGTFAFQSQSAFADKTTEPNENATSTVSLLVNPSITLEVEVDSTVADPNPDTGDKNAMLIRLSPNQKSEGRFLARVSTNRDYILQLNGLDGDTTMTHESDGNSFIPGTGCTVAGGTDCWGVVSWSSDYTNPPDPAYKSIPAVATEFARGTGPVTEEETRFEVGISASSDVAAGSYKGKLVVTASNI